MANIAVLKFEKTGVKVISAGHANDAEALASIKAKGSYAFVEVHEVDPKAKKQTGENE